MLIDTVLAESAAVIIASPAAIYDSAFIQLDTLGPITIETGPAFWQAQVERMRLTRAQARARVRRAHMHTSAAQPVPPLRCCPVGGAGGLRQ